LRTGFSKTTAAKARAAMVIVLDVTEYKVGDGFRRLGVNLKAIGDKDRMLFHERAPKQWDVRDPQPKLRIKGGRRISNAS
jgi:hypothetical protein